MLIAMAGLPGTGKSTLAQHLADVCSSIVLNKDLFGLHSFPLPRLSILPCKMTSACLLCFRLPPICFRMTHPSMSFWMGEPFHASIRSRL